MKLVVNKSNNIITDAYFHENGHVVNLVIDTNRNSGFYTVSHENQMEICVCATDNPNYDSVILLAENKHDIEAINRVMFIHKSGTQIHILLPNDKLIVEGNE